MNAGRDCATGTMKWFDHLGATLAGSVSVRMSREQTLHRKRKNLYTKPLFDAATDLDEAVLFEGPPIEASCLSEDGVLDGGVQLTVRVDLLGHLIDSFLTGG